MDFQKMKVIKEIKPSGKMVRSISEVKDSKYILVFSSDSEKSNYIEIYDLNDYSQVFSQKMEELNFISELRCGNFVISSGSGKIEIASIELDTKTLNIIQELEGHKSHVSDIKELSNGKLVSCSNNGEIIFWTLDPALNIYNQSKYMNKHPLEYSSFLEDTNRNKLICSPCFDSQGTCILDLDTYEVLATFEDIAGNGGNEIYFVNDKIVIDNSAADEVGLFFIDMDKNEIVKHDEKFNDNKSICFLKLKNGHLLCSVAVEYKNMNFSGSDDEENSNEKNEGRTDIQCWEIDETGLNWKLLYTKEKVDSYPVSCMIELSDGKVITGSKFVKIYQ